MTRMLLMKVVYLLLFLLLLKWLPSYAGAMPIIKEPKSSCVVINQVYFTPLRLFPLVTSKHVSEWKSALEGLCASDETLLVYADYLNQQLAEVGYITSYIHYPQQNLLFGVLYVDLIAGKLQGIEFQDGVDIGWSLANAFPLQRGDVVHLHQLNQGLANLRNTQLVPYQIQIISDNERDNMNQLIIQRTAVRAFKGRLLFESKQSQEQPNQVISQVVMLANPLLLNDFFFFSLDSDIGQGTSKKFKSASLLYSIPYHYWLLSFYAGYQESTAYKNIQLFDQIALKNDLRNRLLLMQAEYVLHRSLNSTTSASVGAQVQTLDVFLNNYRLKTQQRFSSYGLFGLSHKRDFLQGSVAVSISYKQSLDWFGSTRKQTTGLDRARIYQFSADYQRQFTFMNQPMYHRHEVELQLSHAKLDPLLEVNTITGRFGIRGFTGSLPIENAGENTVKIKNEWGWLLPWQEHKFYSGLDFASTYSERARFWQKNKLLGGEVGIQGQYKRMGYKVFFELPLWYSSTIKADPILLGAKLSIDY
ncbi:ShlB/FhaC/HecB family hemolysin secretion/activation protein [Providencia manganoxydans]|uniref:ShlB/FhaC/HecB family hemolysin secretion/activation protein n=2 Tax=Providencia manganoxydans TaxID=2923283 RepID=UPI0034E550D7